MIRITAILCLLLAVAAPAAAREPVPFTFSGNLRFEAEDLVAVAPDEFERYRRTKNATRAEDAAYELARFYREQGFPYSSVEIQFVDAGAVFLIREGPRVFLGEVTVDGTESAETLAEFVKPPRSWFLGSRLYVQESLDQAASKMTAWLRQRGHLRAEVVGPAPLDETLRVPPPGDIELSVRYEIEEGPRHVVRAIEEEGAGPWAVRVREETAHLIDGPYSPFVPYEIQGTVEEVLANASRLWARVRVEEEMKEDGDEVAVTLRVDIQPGPRAEIGRIEVIGNLRVKEAAVRRELTIGPGDAYRAKDLQQSQRRLFGARLFSQVNAKLEGGEPEGADPQDVLVRPLRIRVEEVPFRNLDTSIGFGSWELLRGSLGMEWLNVDGMGRTLKGEVAASVRGFRVTGRASDPWIFGVEHLLGALEASYEEQERPTYVYDRLLVDASVQKEIGYKLVGKLGWSLSHTEVTAVSGDVPEEFENSTNLSTLRFGLVREARDNPWDPTEGSLLSGSVEFSDRFLGSDLDFVRARARAVQLLPLSDDSPRLVLVGVASLGAIFPFADTSEIPIQERFFLGGGQTVRSFAEDELGPRIENGDSDTPSGGEFFSRASVELRFPLAGSLEGAVFGDAGNVIRKVHDAGLDDYRFALGGGLRYRTPIGPIRLDFGWNPAPRDYEDSWNLQFAIGYPF